MTGYKSPMSLFASTIEQAKSGNVDAAKKLLKWYCGAIAANTDKDGNKAKSSTAFRLSLHHDAH